MGLDKKGGLGNFVILGGLKEVLGSQFLVGTMITRCGDSAVSNAHEAGSAETDHGQETMSEEHHEEADARKHVERVLRVVLKLVMRIHIFAHTLDCAWIFQDTAIDINLSIYGH